MSKLTFRPRQLDTSKSMPVFNSVELPDICDYVAINRATLQMPTGMEKEEESELHLQQAISAQQASSTGNQVQENVIIPTPMVHKVGSGKLYEIFYPPTYEKPSTHIKVQALNIEPESPDYDLDTDDEKWLDKIKGEMIINPLDMEAIMDRLEKASQHQVAKIQEVKHLLQNIDDDVIVAVYDFWLDKRHRHNAQPLMPRVKTERRDGGTGVNPYIAFRRRAEKMQTRKNRKNDEESYERILKLSQDLRKAVTLFDMVKRREKTKREIISLDLEVMDRRFKIEDWQNEVYKEIQNRIRPSFAFASPNKEDFLSRTSLKRKREKEKRQRKQKLLLSNEADKGGQDSGLASREWLLQKQEEWHRPVTVPGSTSFHTSGSVRRLGGGSEDLELDGRYAFRRSKGCVYYQTRPSTSKQDEREQLTEATPTSSVESVTDPNPQSSGPVVGISPKPREDHAYQRKRAGPRKAACGDQAWPWQDPRRHPYLKFWHLNLHSTRNKGLRYVGLARARRGRGGRLLFDRATRSEAERFMGSVNEDNFLVTASAPSSAVNSNTSETISGGVSVLETKQSAVVTDSRAISSNPSSSISNTGQGNAPTSQSRILSFRPRSPVAELNDSFPNANFFVRNRGATEMMDIETLARVWQGRTDPVMTEVANNSKGREERYTPMAILTEEEAASDEGASSSTCLPIDTGVGPEEYKWHCGQLAHSAAKKTAARRGPAILVQPDPLVTIEKPQTYGITTAVLSVGRVTQLVDRNQKSASPDLGSEQAAQSAGASGFLAQNRDTGAGVYRSPALPLLLPPPTTVTSLPRFSVRSQGLAGGGNRAMGLVDRDGRTVMNHPVVYGRSNGTRNATSAGHYPTAPARRASTPGSGQYSPVESSAVPGSGFMSGNSNKGMVSPLTSSTVPPIAVSPSDHAAPYSTANIRVGGGSSPHVTSNGEIEVKTTHPRYQQHIRPVR